GWIFGDDLMQAIVDAARDRSGAVGGKFLGRRGAVREHLDVDASLVHFFEPQRAEIFKPRILLAGPAGLAADKRLFQFVVLVMLSDRNDRTMRFLEQGGPSRFSQVDFTSPAQRESLHHPSLASRAAGGPPPPLSRGRRNWMLPVIRGIVGALTPAGAAAP